MVKPKAARKAKSKRRAALPATSQQGQAIGPIEDPRFTPEEWARVEAHRERDRRLGFPRFAAKAENVVVATGDDELTKASVAAATGTTDQIMGLAMLDQVAKALPATVGNHQSDRLNAAMASMMGVQPQDALEGKLAAQMVAVHNLIMTFSARAAGSTDLDVVSQNADRVVRLSRTYTLQLEAMTKYRGRGQQRITVEHVTVNEGGQAIVGSVTSVRDQAPSAVPVRVILREGEG